MGLAIKPYGNVLLSYDGNESKVFTKSQGFWQSLTIVNDGTSSIILIVHGLNIVINSEEEYTDNFADFNNVEVVSNNNNYRIVIRG